MRDSKRPVQTLYCAASRVGLDCLQLDGYFVGFGKQWVRLPPFVESDGINLMFARLNQERGWIVLCELSLPPSNKKFLSVYCRQFKRDRLIAPAVPVFPHGLRLGGNIRKYNIKVAGFVMSHLNATTKAFAITRFGDNREGKGTFLNTII